MTQIRMGWPMNGKEALLVIYQKRHQVMIMVMGIQI